MKKTLLTLTFIAFISHAIATDYLLPKLSPPKQSKIAFIGDDGKLEYESWNERGDILIDYSHAGYKNGGVMLPDVPAIIRLAPVRGVKDDTQRIQAAIDKVGARQADENGFRGAVLLKKGRYPISGTLRISQSGVVLRGEGQSQNGTVLYAFGKRHSDTKQSVVIRIGGSGSFKRLEDTRTKITDDYVPVGVRSFNVADASHFKSGSQVMVYRPATQEWLDDIRMSKIVEDYNNPDCTNWTTSQYSMYWLRKVEAVEGNRITLDAPIVQALDSKYGGGELVVCMEDGIISNVAVESLYIQSRFDPDITCNTQGQSYHCDEDHAWTAIYATNARDGWVKNVSIIWVIVAFI